MNRRSQVLKALEVKQGMSRLIHHSNFLEEFSWWYNDNIEKFGWPKPWFYKEELFNRAIPVFITSEFFDLCLQAARTFPGQSIKTTDFLFPQFILVFERPWRYPDDPDSAGLVEAVEFKSYRDTRPESDKLPTDVMMHVMFWRRDMEWMKETNIERVPIPDHLERESKIDLEACPGHMAYIIALMISQRIADRIDGRSFLTRQITRNFQRRLGAVPEIVVVDLPRREQPSSGEAGGKVDWSHRWLVKGHWTNQWCPSIKDHRLMWIHPFIKGPEDKPFIAKQVVGVTRSFK